MLWVPLSVFTKILFILLNTTFFIIFYYTLATVGWSFKKIILFLYLRYRNDYNYIIVINKHKIRTNSNFSSCVSESLFHFPVSSHNFWQKRIPYQFFWYSVTSWPSQGNENIWNATFLTIFFDDLLTTDCCPFFLDLSWAR